MSFPPARPPRRAVIGYSLALAAALLGLLAVCGMYAVLFNDQLP